MLSAADILMAFAETFSSIILYAVIGVAADRIIFAAMRATGADHKDAHESAALGSAFWPIVIPLVVAGLVLRVFIRLFDAGLAITYLVKSESKRPTSRIGRM